MLSNDVALSHKLLKFNDKARRSIVETGYLNVWEGGVRSSKTTTSMMSFCIDFMLSTGNVAVMCGYSVETLLTNCIIGDYGFLEMFPYFELVTLKDNNDNSTGKSAIKILKYKKKIIYLLSYNNIQAFKRIRGRTVDKIYVDEINLAPISFVRELFNRTLASKDEKHFWTLNPDDPEHPIYTEYIDRYRDEKLPGYHWWHFTIDDNPAITGEKKEQAKRAFSGIMYDKFILGLRVRPEGRIYTEFNENTMIIDSIPEDERLIIVEAGVDYFGGNEKKSATTHYTVGIGINYNHVYILDEFYDNHTMDFYEIRDNLKTFIDTNKEMYSNFSESYHDPANRFLWDIIKAGTYKVNIRAAAKTSIMGRIMLEKTLMNQNRLHVMRHCTNLVSAFNNAKWDHKKTTGSERLDDGSAKIDCLDGIEYVLERHRKELLRI